MTIDGEASDGGEKKPRRLSMGQLAKRVFSPRWRPVSDEDLASLGDTPTEAWEALEARGLIEPGTVGSDRRCFAARNSLSGDSFGRAHPKLPVPKFRSLEEAGLGLLAGAVVGAGLDWFSRTARRTPVTFRSLASGSLAGAMAVATGDPEGIMRTARLPMSMLTTPSPPSVDVAVSFALLGDAASVAEKCALDAAFRLHGAQPKFIVWRFHTVYEGTRWRGLQSEEDSKAFTAAREELMGMVRRSEWGTRIYGPPMLPMAPTTAKMHAEFTRQAANAWDWALKAGRGARDNPFAPLYEVWCLGCAVERSDRDYVTISAPLWPDVSKVRGVAGR